jgi:hypothetical protein
MPETLRSRNYVALGLLIVGKLLGIGGLVVGSSFRVLGGTLLGLDGLFILSAVVLCLRTMKARAREDMGQKAVLRQMMKEGTLKQYLRDLEAEEHAKASGDGDGEARRSSVERESDPRGQTAFS